MDPALLGNPDATLVASILTRSPHPLPEGTVRRLLDDRRRTGDGFVCDAAAARLTGKKPPPGRSERDALIRSLKR